jgi:MSHA biogenesis protein MshM
MYQEHFGLTELPFGITPDTSFAFACVSHQEALNTLLVAVKNGEGFIKITGEVGTGKTLLCRRFLATLDDGYVSAYIPNPYLEPRALLLALADELRIDVPKDADQHQLMKLINTTLLELAGDGKSVVLCLDEVQAMPLDTLEALRLLTNLETEKRKLLQVVLFGQPELDERLAQESVRQLRQRIAFQYRLASLHGEELDYYLEHRLRVAGHRGNRVFGPAAVKTLAKVSGGVPRLVNILAHKSMLLAYGEGVQQVMPHHVRAAAADTPAAPGAGFRWLPALYVMLLTLIGVAAWAALK